jgi:hypothetical protein
LDDFGVCVDILWCLDNLQGNLYQSPGKIPDGDELSKGSLDDGFELPLSRAFGYIQVSFHDEIVTR